MSEEFYESKILNNASHLTKEVHNKPLNHLKKMFGVKIKELNECKQENNLAAFNSDTL